MLFEQTIFRTTYDTIKDIQRNLGIRTKSTQYKEKI